MGFVSASVKLFPLCRAQEGMICPDVTFTPKHIGFCQFCRTVIAKLRWGGNCPEGLDSGGALANLAWW